MKKLSILFLIMCGAWFTGTAQTTTYGFATGTLGTDNSFFGAYAGNAANASSSDNVFIGRSSGLLTTSGAYNSAIGSYALRSNTTGNGNLAMGLGALYYNSTGSDNVAIGGSALYTNFTGTFNIAIGYEAMADGGGFGNVAIGGTALFGTDGDFNVGVGVATLSNTWSGTENSALGHSAGPNDDFSNTTSLGNGAVTTASDQVRIGNSSVTSIGGQTGWSILSDGRFKRELREDVSGLDFINMLRPVSYFVDKNAVDKFLGVPDSVIQRNASTRGKPIRQTGFVAQEVEKVVKSSGFVFSGIDAPKNEKDHYSIRYADFVVPLVKAVQELSTKVEEQQIQIEKMLEKLNENGLLEKDKGSIKTGLFQNTPNPFSADTEIKMVLPETTFQAQIIIYNLEGKQLKSIPVKERGNASVKISGNELNPGMYLYTLIVDGKVIDTKRMVLTK